LEAGGREGAEDDRERERKRKRKKWNRNHSFRREKKNEERKKNKMMNDNDQLNEYEAERAARVAANRARLGEWGRDALVEGERRIGETER